LESARWERRCGDPDRAAQILEEAVSIVDRHGMPTIPLAVGIHTELEDLRSNGS
jgi:hypothetical protein